MNRITIAALTAEAFAPFGRVGMPARGSVHGAAGDVPLDLSQGQPRFYIMRLETRGLSFDRLARHDRVTQCLGATDGQPWLMAVAPAGVKEPKLADIRAFSIPADQFIMLAQGTWHAGPIFAEAQRDFYNLELSDTNTADFTVHRLDEPVDLAPA